MAEITHIDEFLERRIKKAEADWSTYMDRAAELRSAGKTIFAEQMTRKAHDAAVLISKLKKQRKAKATPLVKVTSYENPKITVTYSGPTISLDLTPRE